MAPNPAEPGRADGQPASCDACGAPVPQAGRFCPMCGAALAAAPSPRQSRKNVVVLFTDVVGSTSLGERLDPESLRQVMDSYFAACAGAITDHGGVVEKFIGDAVMAVFGVPVAHGDDALRAVHAAVSLAGAVGELNATLGQTHGTRLELRTGICSGQVAVTYAPNGDFRVVGDAVNTAARLQTAAGPGEILIGGETARMVRGQVELAAVPPLTLKGKAAAVPAARVISLEVSAADVPSAPLVGRTEELEQLRQSGRRAIAQRQCCQVTLLGSPGLGKSRLVREFLAGLPEAEVLTGQCRSYGRGATYQPLAGLLESVPGGWPVIEQALAGNGVSALDCLRELTGRGAGGLAAAAGIEEISWAVRLLFESLAATRPLVVVWEDLHWAEPTLLDLIDELGSWLTDAPVLLLCLARPELLEVRPGWGGGKPSALTLELGPLSRDQTAALVALLASADEVYAHAADAACERVVETAEGNPLFAELMLDMIAEGADGELPPTIQAVMEARLDQLPLGERDLLERAAVIGREFSQDQLTVFGPPPGPAPDGDLQLRLTRRRLIQRSGPPGRYRFAQLLIRDTAYGMSPKADRARRHQLMADWLAGQGQGGGGDPQAARAGLLGYHLEAACQLTRDLRPGDPALPDLMARAASVLIADGQLAMRRKDLPAAAALLERGRDLLPDGDLTHRAMALHLSDCWLGLRDDRKAMAALDTAQAALRGDPRTATSCAVQRGLVALRSGTAPMAEVRAQAQAAAAVLRADPADDLGWCRLGQLQAFLLLADERIADAEAALREAMARARRIGDSYAEDRILAGICELALWGRTPAGAGLALCAELTGRFAADRTLLVPVTATRAGLSALAGDIDGARRYLTAAAHDIRELHLELAAAIATQISGLVESLAGQHAAAEQAFRTGAAALRGAGLEADAQTLEVCAARELLSQGQAASARRALDRAQAGRAHPDLRTRLLTAALRGRLAAAEGQAGDGVAAARAAVELASGTDDLRIRGDVLFDLAQVLAQAGQEQEAAQAAAQALDTYRAKGATLPAGQVGAWLAARQPDHRGEQEG